MPVELFSAQTGIIIDDKDFLVVSTRNSLPGVAISIEARVMDLEGRIHHHRFSHTPNTDRSSARSEFRVGAGLLVGVGVAATAGSPKRGQTFFCLFLSRDAAAPNNLMVPLTADYVVSGVALGWPGAPLRSSVEGPGIIRQFTGTDPAAGAEIVEVVPTGARWRLLGMRFRLITDANVGLRSVRMAIDDGVNIIVQSGPNATQAENDSGNYHVSRSTVSPNNAADRFINMAADIFMMAGFRIRTTTGGIQAGDNFIAPQMLVEEWIES